jgi:F0F1-type ATP synthase assembly protein I
MNGHGEPMQDQPRSHRSEKVDGMNLGMQVLSYLIAGVAFYGFLGWLGDRLLDTGFLLPIGIVLGAGLGCYVIIRRFGRVEDVPSAPGGSEGVPPELDTAKRGEAMITTKPGETDERAR